MIGLHVVSSPTRPVHEERSRRRESPTGEDGKGSGKRVAALREAEHCPRKYKSRGRFGPGAGARPFERGPGLVEMRQLEERGAGPDKVGREWTSVVKGAVSAASVQDDVGPRYQSTVRRMPSSKDTIGS